MGNDKIIYYKVIIKYVSSGNMYYNLISINQFCDIDYYIEFQKHICTVKSVNWDIVLTALREKDI